MAASWRVWGREPVSWRRNAQPSAATTRSSPWKGAVGDSSACAAREEVTILAAEVRRRGRSRMVLGGQGAPVRARAQVSEDGEDLQLHAAQQERGRRETQA